jgi:hypothetical protein
MDHRPLVAHRTTARIAWDRYFLMLTLISMTQAVVAILINARTLRRTIGVGNNG